MHRKENKNRGLMGYIIHLSPRFFSRSVFQRYRTIFMADPSEY